MNITMTTGLPNTRGTLLSCPTCFELIVAVGPFRTGTGICPHCSQPINLIDAEPSLTAMAQAMGDNVCLAKDDTMGDITLGHKGYPSEYMGYGILIQEWRTHERRRATYSFALMMSADNQTEINRAMAHRSSYDHAQYASPRTAAWGAVWKLIGLKTMDIGQELADNMSVYTDMENGNAL